MNNPQTKITRSFLPQSTMAYSIAINEDNNEPTYVDGHPYRLSSYEQKQGRIYVTLKLTPKIF